MAGSFQPLPQGMEDFLAQHQAPDHEKAALREHLMKVVQSQQKAPDNPHFSGYDAQDDATYPPGNPLNPNKAPELNPKLRARANWKENEMGGYEDISAGYGEKTPPFSDKYKGAFEPGQVYAMIWNMTHKDPRDKVGLDAFKKTIGNDTYSLIQTMIDNPPNRSSPVRGQMTQRDWKKAVGEIRRDLGNEAADTLENYLGQIED